MEKVMIKNFTSKIIEVPLLTTAEIVKIVKKGAAALNISISTETAAEIANFVKWTIT